MDQHHAAATLTREHDDHETCGRCIGRRTALMGMGAVGVAGLLAACGGAEEPSTSGAPTDTADPGTTSTAAGADPTPSEEPPAPTEEPSAPAEEPDGEALTTTAEVPVGGGVILHDPGVVVTQPTDGTFVAFSTTCTHQGCAVTSVADGLITCDCHGSQYNVADGTVARGPAQSPLAPVSIVVEGDQILAG